MLSPCINLITLTLKYVPKNITFKCSRTQIPHTEICVNIIGKRKIPPFLLTLHSTPWNEPLTVSKESISEICSMLKLTARNLQPRQKFWCKMGKKQKLLSFTLMQKYVYLLSTKCSIVVRITRKSQVSQLKKCVQSCCSYSLSDAGGSQPALPLTLAAWSCTVAVCFFQKYPTYCLFVSFYGCHLFKLYFFLFWAEAEDSSTYPHLNSVCVCGKGSSEAS